MKNIGSFASPAGCESRHSLLLTQQRQSINKNVIFSLNKTMVQTLNLCSKSEFALQDLHRTLNRIVLTHVSGISLGAVLGG